MRQTYVSVRTRRSALKQVQVVGMEWKERPEKCNNDEQDESNTNPRVKHASAYDARTKRQGQFQCNECYVLMLIRVLRFWSASADRINFQCGSSEKATPNGLKFYSFKGEQGSWINPCQSAYRRHQSTTYALLCLIIDVA